jgi:hypothetical protein
MELERARALLAEQNAALELATVEAEIADVKANLAMESLRIGTAEFVNRFDFAPVGYGFQQSGPFGGMFSLSSSTDRVHGRDYPWLVSEADIRNSVGLARLVTKSHCPGVAIERNLKAHVIGKGGNYTAGVRKGAKVPDGLLEAIQDLVDEFVDENKILGEGEHEWYWRGVRDGETIVGLYPMPKGRHGIVDARENRTAPSVYPWNGTANGRGNCQAVWPRHHVRYQLGVRRPQSGPRRAANFRIRNRVRRRLGLPSSPLRRPLEAEC